MVHTPSPGSSNAYAFAAGSPRSHSAGTCNEPTGLEAQPGAEPRTKDSSPEDRPRIVASGDDAAERHCLVAEERDLRAKFAAERRDRADPARPRQPRRRGGTARSDRASPRGARTAEPAEDGG